MKPLPKETYLTPWEDLKLGITINASITSKDEITISLGHSSKGIYQDITKFITFEISEIEDENKVDFNDQLWSVNVTLPYPYSQSSGDLILSVGDSHSGDITSTQLIIKQEEKESAPFFDPLPRSVEAYTGDDVFINAGASGLSPISVSE